MSRFHIDPEVVEVCRAVRSAGGRALLVGGGVRDRLRGRPSKDYDLEVYGIAAGDLEALLRGLGRVNAVGASFAVYKLAPAAGAGPPLEIDVSLPRRESKSGRGHRGFEVRGDPSMPVAEAARRRDFTMNAVLYDALSDELIDPFDGIRDIERGLIRAVDPRTFVEDSLRVLRAVQFAARFEFEIEPATRELCRSMDLGDLARERVRAEFEKLLLLAERPSIGLRAALELRVLEQRLPELLPLVGCPQDPEWHPEGDVFTHTLIALDNAAALSAGLPPPKRLTVLLAELLHDIAKPATTRIERGRVRSPGHDEAGRGPALRVLEALDVHRMQGYDVRGQVLELVAHHLKPSHFHHDRERVGDGAFRRLARRCDLELLYLVAKADALARGEASGCEAQEWFIARARALSVEHEAPRPLLMGRHLLDLGLAPGPRVGEILDAVYERQLDGELSTLEEALAAARELLEADGPGRD